jgi:hypothetical protein
MHACVAGVLRGVCCRLHSVHNNMQCSVCHAVVLMLCCAVLWMCCGCAALCPVLCRVVSPEGTYTLQAESEYERAEWIASLQVRQGGGGCRGGGRAGGGWGQRGWGWGCTAGLHEGGIQTAAGVFGVLHW